MVQIADGDGIVGEVEQLGLFADFFVRQLALGDVAPDADQAGHRPPRIIQGHFVGKNGAQFAVGELMGLLVVKVLFSGENFAVDAVAVGRVVRVEKIRVGLANHRGGVHHSQSPGEGLVGEHVAVGQIPHIDGVGNIVDQGAQQVAFILQGRFRLLLFEVRALGDDAEGQIPRQFVEQANFFIAKYVRFLGVDGEHGEDFFLIQQGQGDHGGEAALGRGLAPGGGVRVGQEITTNDHLTFAKAGADRSPPAILIVPRDLQAGQITLITAGEGGDAHGFFRVIIWKSNPSQPITAIFHDDAANFVKQFRFAGGAHQHLIAFADGFQGALGVAESAFNGFSFGNNQGHYPQTNHAN